MKINLEAGDLIMLKQTDDYSYICSIGEKEGQGVNWSLQDAKAEQVFGAISGEKDLRRQHSIVENIYTLCEQLKKDISEDKEYAIDVIDVNGVASLKIEDVKLKLDNLTKALEELKSSRPELLERGVVVD